MKCLLLVATLAVVLSLVNAGTLRNRGNAWDRKMVGMYNLLKQKAAGNATFREMLHEHFETFGQAPEEKMVDYQCDLPKSPAPPTSAHAVRPGDFDVIASLGDSITAGYGITAQDVIEVLLNDRHYSWVTGGIGSLEGGVVTVTNILRKFNAGISGFSYGESWAEDREAGLNVAEGGAIGVDMPAQARYLIQKMKDPLYGVDYENDWKLISLMVGGNDLCSVCYGDDVHSPATFGASMQEALDILYAEVPRAIVVVSNIFDVTPLPAFSDNIICDIIQATICGCAEEGVAIVQETQRQYISLVTDLVASGRYDRGREDFTVVVMPHFDQAQPPKIPGTDNVDRSYWSPDCFHPGMKAHYAIATSLWNQMFDPVGPGRRTELDWQIGANLVCPTEADPFVKTNINSVVKQ